MIGAKNFLILSEARRRVVEGRTALCAVLVLLFLAAAPAYAADSVSVGWTPSAPMAPALLAAQKGYFTKLDLAVDLDAFRGAMDALSALATGKLDVSLGGVTAGLFNAAHAGLDARVVAPLSIQPPAPGSTPLVARRDLWDNGYIRSAADLKGKRVAVNGTGNGVDYRLSLVLEGAGLGLKDVDLQKLSFPDMLTAFGTAGIDAGMVGEPFGTMAQKLHLGVIVMSESGQGEGDVNTVVTMSGKFIRERRDVAVRFLAALRLGMLDLQDGKWRDADNVAIVAKALSVDPTIFLASSFPRFDPSLRIAPYMPSVRRQEAMHAKNGFLQYKPPVDEAALVDPSLAAEAAKR